jgi:hypothetical protein
MASILDYMMLNQNLIDSYSFGAQSDDISEGRYPNGSGDFSFMEPTPGSENMMPLSSRT